MAYVCELLQGAAQLIEPDARLYDPVMFDPPPEGTKLTFSHTLTFACRVPAVDVRPSIARRAAPAKVQTPTYDPDPLGKVTVDGVPKVGCMYPYAWYGPTPLLTINVPTVALSPRPMLPEFEGTGL
jgi:hypothetical protein